MMMANTHLQHTLNTSAEEIVGRYNIFQAPEEINKVSAKHFQRALQGEQTTTPPTSYHLDRAGFPTSPNHLPLWLQSSFIPIYGQNSSLHSVGVVCIDLTSQITSEQELQKSERRFQMLIEHNADAMIVVQDDHIRFSNPAAAALFGCGVNDLHGYPFGYPVTIDSKIEVDIYNRHGRHIIAEMCVVETEWEQQPAYLATLRDITDHKRIQQELIDTHRELERRVAERTTELHLANAVLKQKIDEAEQITAALRDSEDRYRTIVTNVPVIIFTTNEDGILTLSEGKGLEELGLKPGQLVGQSIFGVYHDIPDGLDAVRRALRGEFVIWEGQVMGRTYESRLTPIFNKAGQVIRIIGLAIDVTERKAAEQAIYEAKQDLEKRVEERTAKLRILNEELSQAIRAKDDFLANMSHELRTPLNAILGLSEAIQEGIYGEVTEGQAKTLRTIETSGQHLLSLINDILDLSKIEAGKMELDYTTVNVKRICRESMEFVTHQANQKRIDVTFEIDVSVTTIDADELRLKQILINLLTNAVKFTPEGGFIGLEVSDDDENICFIVWDTGIGIETAMLPNLFRPFVQLDSGLNRRHGGDRSWSCVGGAAERVARRQRGG